MENETILRLKEEIRNAELIDRVKKIKDKEYPRKKNEKQN